MFCNRIYNPVIGDTLEMLSLEFSVMIPKMSINSG